MEIPATTETVQLMFLQTHNRDAHGAMQAPLEQRGVGETGAKAQKLVRPLIPEDCSEVQWAFFIDKWEDYKGCEWGRIPQIMPLTGGGGLARDRGRVINCI